MALYDHVAWLWYVVITAAVYLVARCSGTASADSAVPHIVTAGLRS